MKKVSIIIINLNGKKFLKNCLKSIIKNTNYENYNIIVVDNGSTDGSQQLIKSKFKKVELIENKKNEGFSKANNLGINFAIKRYHPDYFYLLNNDTFVNKDWLNEAIRSMEKSEKRGIVGSRQFTFEKKPAISAGWIKTFKTKYYFGEQEKEVEWVSGAGFMIKKEVFEKIGLFDEMYSPLYYEESDFEKRAFKNDFKIIYSPKSIFFHAGGGDSKNEKLINLNEVFYVNRARFFSKYLFSGLIIRFFLDLFRTRKKIKILRLIELYFNGIKYRKKTIIKNPYLK
jgi:GT2 family glycosyltransferase